MIFNRTLNDGQINIGTPAIPRWVGLKGADESNPSIKSVTEGGNVTTASLQDVVIPGMTLSPPAGNYLTLFSAKASSSQTFNSSQGITDVNAIYTELMNYEGDDPDVLDHDLVFGNDEVLSPGVYKIVGAPSIAGNLIIDGEGDADSIFIIKGSGAFTTGTNTVVSLINNANSNNIFWVSEGAMSTGAPTIMKGTLISNNNAIALGANTNLEGRMFSTIGALTMGARSNLTKPSGVSTIDLGVLFPFVMFTASGGISGCPDCTITGDVGTGGGAATSFDRINGTVYPPGTTSTPNTSSYSIYKNGIFVANSRREIYMTSSIIYLQSLISVAEGETVDVRWKVDDGQAIVNNRTLSLIRSQ
jgi:hypothetical protein